MTPHPPMACISGARVVTSVVLALALREHLLCMPAEPTGFSIIHFP